MKKNLLLIFTFVLLLATAVSGKVPRENVVEIPAIADGLCLHNLFQSNMVLQRDKVIVIWGWAEVGEKVTVEFDGKQQTAKAAADRRWEVNFEALNASTKPRKMTVKGTSKTLTLENILMGDVWVLGGQSNMEFPITKVENGSLEIISANFPQIRILTVPYGNQPQKSFARLDEWSGWFGRHFRKGDWDICSPQTVSELSAIGYVFARRLHMATQVPIGVIDVSRGGTTVETWTPDAVLRKMDSSPVKEKLAVWDEKIAGWDSKADLQKRIVKHHAWVERMKKQGRKIPASKTIPTGLLPGPAFDQNRPANCYNGMLVPISGLNVKGAIFHQGYNNALGAGSKGAQMYEDIFPEMITAWRSAFNDPTMPFGIISLCTGGAPQNRDDVVVNMADDGPFIREAQYKTFLKFHKAGDKNIGFVSSFDCRRRWYHPQLKVPVGERIARWALGSQYGFAKAIQWQPPMLKDMKAEKGKLLLYFDNRLRAVDDGAIKGFVIAGKDQKFQPAKVDYLNKDRSILVLSSSLVKEPLHFRHAWARNPDTNLQIEGNKDIPLATQRSDNWQMESARAIKGAYKLEDTRRRLQEAKDFIDKNKKAYDAAVKKKK